MVNALSQPAPGHGRENTATQQRCSEKTPTTLDWSQTGTATAADAHRHPPRLRVGLHRLGHRSHRRAQASLLGERSHCLDTILLNLRRGHLSRFGAKKHIDRKRSVARPWPRLRPPTLPLWSSCILHPKLANFDERGQQEVIFGLTAHGEKN